MITVNSPIVGRGGSVEEALAALDTPDAIDAEYAGTLLRLCNETGLDYRIAFGQFCVETANGTSPRWLTNRNPAGLGIAADGDPDPGTFDGTEAASVHIRALHMAAIDSNIVDNPVTPASADAFFSRWYKKITDPSYPRDVIRTVADLCRHYADASGEQQATWAWDATYADQIAQKVNLIFKDTGGTTMTYTTVYPGLPGGPLVTTYPVNLDFVLPASQTLNRPGIVAHLPRRSVQHGNGNPSGYAAADAQWLRNGAPGNNGPQQLSFHCTGDYKGIWGCVPANEVTWQAADGSGPGNYNGFSCEMSEHAAIRGNDALLDQTISVVADFMGRVAARLGIAIPEQHWSFNAGDPDRHDCPNMLRHDTINGRSCWDIYVERWNAAKADELKRMTGGTAVAEPFAITWEPGAVGVQTIGETKALALLGEVTAKRAVPLRQSVSSTSPVVHTLKAGEKATIVGTYRDPKTSRRWAFVKYADGKVGRCLLSSVTPSFPTL